jgi:hypothetical protein
MAAFGVTAWAAEDAPATVTAVVIPDEHYSPAVLQEMRNEAARILRNSDVTLHWELGIPRQAFEGLLVVVRLHGECDAGASGPESKRGPLGWSHQVNGRLLPFSDLACDNIRGAVQSVQGRENRLPANLLLGRAMGRVLAHELYHIVADTSRHGRVGVAQRAFSSRDLASGQLNLEPVDSDAIKSGLERFR